MDRVQLQLSTEHIESIVGFLGYGNPERSVWFIGLEEGLGEADDEDAIQNLRARGLFKEIMDLRDAHHKRLRENGKQINFDAKPPSTPVWQWIAKIMCAFSGDDWKNYVKFRLGGSGGDTFLTELSPIPSSSVKNKNWMEAFQELDGNLAEKLENRRRRLLRLLEEKNPRMVICYGDGAVKRREFERFFGIQWSPIGTRISKDPKRNFPFLLLPFFGLGQMSQSVIDEMRSLCLLPAPST